MAFQMTTWFSLPPSSPSKRAPHTEGGRLDLGGQVFGLRTSWESGAGWRSRFYRLGFRRWLICFLKNHKGCRRWQISGNSCDIFWFWKRWKKVIQKDLLLGVARLVGRLEDWHLKISQVVVFWFFSGDFLAIRCCPPFFKKLRKKNSGQIIATSNTTDFPQMVVKRLREIPENFREIWVKVKYK